MRRSVLVLAAAAGFALAVVPALAHDESVGTTSSDWTKKTLAVAPGHKVTVQNTGGYHDLVWGDAAPGVAGPGPAWRHERTFSAEDDGKAITFHCTVHGRMTGTVHVNAAETVPQPDAASGGSTSTGAGTTTTGTTTTDETTTEPSAPAATATQPDSGTEAPGTTSQPETAPAVQDAAGPDRTAPRVARLRARVERRRLVVHLRLDEPARVTVQVLRAGRSAARSTFRARLGTNRLVLRRRLPSGALTARVTVADGAGNVTRRRLRVRR